MKHIAWGLLLVWPESAEAFNLLRPSVSRLRGLHSTANGPHRRNNWERAFSQFSGQHQWHHRRIQKNQFNANDNSKETVLQRLPQLGVRNPQVTADPVVDNQEASVSESAPDSDTFSWAPLVAEIEGAKEDRKVVPSNNSILGLQEIEISTSAVESSTAGTAVKSLSLVNNVSSNINSRTSTISKSVTTSSSSADEFRLEISADSSACSLVHHRPADYAWAAMDVWHMECALHHARSAAAEDEVPVRRKLPHDSIERKFSYIVPCMHPCIRCKQYMRTTCNANIRTCA